MSIDYSNFINKSLLKLAPSGIREFFNIASTIPGVISLGVGEPDFKTPCQASSYAVESIVAGKTQYSPNAGLYELREEISLYLKNRFDISYSPDNEILVTVGASQAIDICLRAIIESGDEVLIPDPGYVSYMPSVVFAGGKAVAVPSYQEDGFKVTASTLEKYISKRTKAMILCYPNNPTGCILSKEELDDIAKVVLKHNLLIISDEIYAELNYSNNRNIAIASHKDLYDRCISINGFSKAFAMTGWRLGYIACNSQLLNQILKIHQYTVMCAPTPSQMAGIKALRDARFDNYSSLENMKQSYNRRRRLMYHSFIDMGLDCINPMGAFYIFPSIRKLKMTSYEFCTQLVRAKKVACVPGTAFGAMGEGNIRCSYATAEDKLITALNLIQEFISERNLL